MRGTSQSDRTARKWCWIIPAAVFVLLPSHVRVLGEDAAPPSENAKTNATNPDPRVEKESADGAGSPGSRKPGSGNFLVVPITTELQRVRRRKHDNAKAYVFINRFSDVEDRALVDLAALPESLKPYATGKPGAARFRVLCNVSERDVSDAGFASFRLYTFGLMALARRAGLQDATVDRSFFRPEWKYMDKWDELVADLTIPPAKEDVEAESGRGDHQVRVYAVRTLLSHFLYGDDTDCVIQILPPIEEADAGILFTMRRCLKQLNLDRRRRVNFLFHTDNPQLANQAQEELAGRHVWKELLGFHHCTWTLWR